MSNYEYKRNKTWNLNITPGINTLKIFVDQEEILNIKAGKSANIAPQIWHANYKLRGSSTWNQINVVKDQTNNSLMLMKPITGASPKELRENLGKIRDNVISSNETAKNDAIRNDCAKILSAPSNPMFVTFCEQQLEKLDAEAKVNRLVSFKKEHVIFEFTPLNDKFVGKLNEWFAANYIRDIKMFTE